LTGFITALSIGIYVQGWVGKREGKKTLDIQVKLTPARYERKNNRTEPNKNSCFELSFNLIWFKILKKLILIWLFILLQNQIKTKIIKPRMPPTHLIRFIFSYTCKYKCFRKGSAPPATVTAVESVARS